MEKHKCICCGQLIPVKYRCCDACMVAYESGRDMVELVESRERDD